MFPVRLACQFCNRTLEIRGEMVEVCTCAEAQQAEAISREQAKQTRQQPQPTWAEIRDRNKMSRRRRHS